MDLECAAATGLPRGRREVRLIAHGDARHFGVITARGPVWANRVLNALSIFAPLAGLAAGLLLLPEIAPTGTTLALFLAFFAAETIGVGLGLHRLFSHRAFETGPLVRGLLGVLGSWGMQGPIERWVADHRRHHRFADRRGDPHSPWRGHRGEALARLAGLWHAHFAWMLTGVVSDPARYAADVRRDPVSRWCSDHYALLCASSLLAPALVGWLAGGAAEAGRAFVWAGCLRVALLQQLTWAVNSVGHVYGSKLAGAPSEGRDNLVFALLLFGEGLHSFHHRFPSAAVNEPARLDLHGAILRGLERLGLVWRLRRYPGAGSGEAPRRAA